MIRIHEEVVEVKLRDHPAILGISKLVIQRTPYILGPPPMIPSSLSVRIGHGIIQAPFTETPFDCRPSFPIIPSNFTLVDTAGIGFLVRFG